MKPKQEADDNVIAPDETLSKLRVETGSWRRPSAEIRVAGSANVQKRQFEGNESWRAGKIFEDASSVGRFVSEICAPYSLR